MMPFFDKMVFFVEAGVRLVRCPLPDLIFKKCLNFPDTSLTGTVHGACPIMIHIDEWIIDHVERVTKWVSHPMDIRLGDLYRYAEMGLGWKTAALKTNVPRAKKFHDR
jgi:hypothetical protein